MSSNKTFGVFLTAPHTSGRALADAFRLIAGFDANTVSKTTIGKIRDIQLDVERKVASGR